MDFSLVRLSLPLFCLLTAFPEAIYCTSCSDIVGHWFENPPMSLGLRKGLWVHAWAAPALIASLSSDVAYLYEALNETRSTTQDSSGK